MRRNGFVCRLVTGDYGAIDPWMRPVEKGVEMIAAGIFPLVLAFGARKKAIERLTSAPDSVFKSLKLS